MNEDERWPVERRRGVLITLADGVRLSGRLTRPAGERRYPALLVYHPYHKYGSPELARHFARRGYAVLEVDLRGTGNSEGATPAPMAPQERDDGRELVEWLAGQPWCSGAVGMYGLSYGGITALGTAATRPPHLKAIVAMHAPSDTYANYMTYHGCRPMLWINSNWAGRMAASNLLPPPETDPSGRWARVWRQRLEQNVPWLLAWHGLPPSADFRAGLRIPCEQIEVPTFLITGWRDQHPSQMLSVFQLVMGPKRLIAGPWKHVLPDLAPTHQIGALHEIDRWWDRWLKGVQNGVEEEPPIALYVQGADVWRSEDNWPVSRARPRRYFLGADGELTDAAEPTGSDVYQYDARVGLGSLGYYGHSGFLEAGDDQSADDLLSATYTTAALPADLEICGEPIARIFVAAEANWSNLVAKLCAVEPGGTSRVISQGWTDVLQPDLDGARRPLAAGEIREVEVRFRPTAYLVRAGERLRLSLSGGDFPEIWPTPEPYQLRIHRGLDRPSHLELPLVATPASSLRQPQFAPPAQELASADALGETHAYRVEQELGSRVARVTTDWTTENRVDATTTLALTHRAVLQTDADRPWLSNLRETVCWELRRPVGRVETRVQTLITWDEIRVHAEIELDGVSFFQRSWAKSIAE